MQIDNAINHPPAHVIRRTQRQNETGSVLPNKQEKKLHAFHYTRVQHLRPEDYHARRTFCENFLRKVDRFPKTLPEDVDDLETRLRYAIWNIEEEVMENVQLNLLKRMRACIRMDGAHFEHLL